MTERKARHGIPMDAESLKQWQDAFLIIELAINNLMGYNEWQEVRNGKTKKGIFKN